MTYQTSGRSRFGPARVIPVRLATVAVALALTGCATQGALQEVRTNSNPADLAQKNITNFTPALRCMDDMMFARGTRDVTVMMEEFRDATQRVPVSARDMMTSAMSDMTRRSRAVRLSVFGSDQQNLAQLLQQAQRANAFGVVPQYNIRGTISQFDDSISKTGGSVGISLVEKLFGVRAGLDTKFSVIGLDAAVVDTSSMTLIPGVSSKNTTVLTSRDASAADGQAKLENPGIGLVFSFSTARSDGPSQAARNMVELATLELVGKLIRAPYWQCLGVPDADPEIQREMDDWFLSMDETERVQFVKEAMREKRYYDGAIDGNADAAFLSALKAYRLALKLPEVGPIDLAFFKLFVTTATPRGPLAATPRKSALASAQGNTQAASNTTNPDPAPAAAAQAAPTAPAAPALTITQQASPNKGANAMNLSVQVHAPGYLYCYSQDPVTRRIQRIFPNRFGKDPRVEPGRPVQLPGQGSFVLNPAAEIACLHAPREIYGDLPPPLRWGDFEDIKASRFEEIRDMFSQASGFAVQLVPKPAFAGKK